MIWLKRRFFISNSAAFFHRCGQLLEVVGHCRRKDEVNDATHVSRRMLIKKHCRVRCQPITIVALSQKADDDEIVAKNARAALGCVACLRDLFRGGPAFGNRREKAKLDRGFDRLSSLMCVKRIKQECWCWLSLLLSFRSHCLSPFRSQLSANAVSCAIAWLRFFRGV